MLNCVGVCYNAIDQQSMMCEEDNKLLLEYNIAEEEANFVVLFDFNLTIVIFIYVLLCFLLFFSPHHQMFIDGHCNCSQSFPVVTQHEA